MKKTTSFTYDMKYSKKCEPALEQKKAKLQADISYQKQLLKELKEDEKLDFYKTVFN